MKARIIGGALALLLGTAIAANASCFDSSDKAMMFDIAKNDIMKAYVERYRTLIGSKTFHACLSDEKGTNQSTDEVVLKGLPKDNALTMILNVAHGTGHDAWRVLLAYPSVRAEARTALATSCVTSPAYELARILMTLPEIADAKAKVEDQGPFVAEIFCKNMRAIYEPSDYDAIVVEIPQYALILNAARARNLDFISVLSAIGQIMRDQLRQPMKKTGDEIAQKR